METVVTIGAVRRAKLQSSRQDQQTNTQFLFTGRMPNQQWQSTLKEIRKHIVCK